MMKPICALCGSPDSGLFHSDKRRDYWRCGQCLLVFVDQDQHLPLAAEKAIYDLHQNNCADTGYREFLSRLAIPLLARLPASCTGLDFGCGPGPALAQMLEAGGHVVTLYDPIYAADPDVLNCQYQFVSCSEVVEHFRQPGNEFDRLFTLLQPGGWLAIMTKLVIDAEAFAKWHYKNDLTHIAFFSRSTFEWLARRYLCHIEFIGQDVIILQRSHHPSSH